LSIPPRAARSSANDDRAGLRRRPSGEAAFSGRNRPDGPCDLPPLRHADPSRRTVGPRPRRPRPDALVGPGARILQPRDRGAPPARDLEALVTAIADTLDELRVPIDSVRGYARNPRRGDLAAIKRSLEVNGQYRPIVVNRRTGEVLAGNHTWLAAREL